MRDTPRVIMAPGYEPTATDFPKLFVDIGTPIPTSIPPTPTIPPLLTDNVVYTLPSQALYFYPLVGWLKQNENPSYVKFDSPDKAAWFEATLETTGYTLEDHVFSTYTENLITALYSGLEEFEIVEKTTGGVRAEFTSRFVQNGKTWYALDTFIQRNEVVYTLSFHALESVWDVYLPSFRSVYESAETQTGYVSSDLIYQFMRSYSDPKNVFNVSIPMGWQVAEAEEIADKMIVESVFSPDNQAEVQTAIFASEKVLTPDDIGQTAIGLMKELVATDIRITQSDVLQDGRIRLDWVSNSTGKSGFTFFWLNGTDLYLLTFMQDNQHSEIYQRMLYAIGDTFQFVNP
ncbi:MAG: hypothetical protein Q7J07_08665 [Pelolinea sp.]|nr:hypothetical protein [Pelolinea sp.]